MGAVSIWQYSGHIMTEATTDGSRSKLAWHDWHDATRGQIAVGACGGTGTALPDDNHCQRGTILDVMQLRTGALVKTANSVDVSLEC